jgi:hypothetical protein
MSDEDISRWEGEGGSMSTWRFPGQKPVSEAPPSMPPEPPLPRARAKAGEIPLKVDGHVVGYAFVEDEDDEGIMVSCIITKPLPPVLANHPISEFSFTMLNNDYES